MTPEAKKTMDKKLRKGIEAVLKSYPPGKYDESELLSDVRCDLDRLIRDLGIDSKTPINVYIEDGILTVSLGTFPNKN